MSIQLEKKHGIRLAKGSSISLEKEGHQLEEVCIGLNWGAIYKKSFFGLLNEMVPVDLDGSATLFDANGNELDTVYYAKLTSKDKAVLHSGDDLTGDLHGDDGKDNEVILVKLKKVNPEVHSIVFHLTSYKKQDFQTIPFAKIRIFEGTRKYVDRVLASFNVAGDTKYSQKTSMVMAKLERQGNSWKFEAIGEPSNGKNIEEVIEDIQRRFV